jgi:hypothetical protein
LGVRFTIAESARKEVLARLLQLNHERHADEVRSGLQEQDVEDKNSAKPRAKPKKPKVKKAPVGQGRFKF